MNIFFLDEDPRKCAICHFDKHCVKMCLEYCQILCSVNHLNGQNNVPYKATHLNHPAIIWCNSSLDNYKWLLSLAKCLFEEYTHRYGRTHASESKAFYWCSLNLPNIPSTGITTRPLIMDKEFIIGMDPIESYRNLYIKGKRHLANWKNRNPPEWWK